MGEVVQLRPTKYTAQRFLEEASQDETIQEAILITKWKDPEDRSIQTSVWYTEGESRLENMGRCFAAAMKLWNNAPHEVEE